MNIVFFGTPDFAVPSLIKIQKSKHEIIAVVTSASKPSGRGLTIKPSAVNVAASELDIPIIEVGSKFDNSILENLQNLNIDIFIVVAFRILPEKIFSIPNHGTVNLHASLLPKYRGSAPIHHAILNGDKETGVTTFRIQRKVDSGDIYLQRKYKLNNVVTTGMVWDDLSHIGADLLLETLDKLEEGKIEPKTQNDTLFSPAPKLESIQFQIHWTHSALEIHNQIRAFSPKPGAYTFWNGKRIKLFNSEVSKCKTKLGVGKGIINNDSLLIGTSCKNLRIYDVQLEGKRKMPVIYFLRGLDLKGEEVKIGFN